MGRQRQDLPNATWNVSSIEKSPQISEISVHFGISWALARHVFDVIQLTIKNPGQI